MSKKRVKIAAHSRNVRKHSRGVSGTNKYRGTIKSVLMLTVAIILSSHFRLDILQILGIGFIGVAFAIVTK